MRRPASLPCCHARPRAFAITLIGMVILSLPGVAAAAAPKPAGDRWAVLVGVDDYTLAGKLQYCGADQRALRERLVAAGFSDAQVVMLEDTAAQSRFRPSKINIERQVDGVLRSAAEGDVVVLSFSGHGTEIDRKMYFVPGDGDPTDPNTLVSLDTVYDRLRECPATVKLVIVDACRNDLRRGGKSAEAADGARALAASLENKPLPEGVVLLSSCAPGEVSWEDDTFRHGVFMHYVLEGLDGKAEADGDGAVSLNELAKYAARHTKAFALKEKSVTQRPYLRNEGEADLLDYAFLPVPGGFETTRAGATLSTDPPNGPLKPGDVTTNSIGMRLVLIEAGEFDMGSNDGPADEKPVHRVRITRPFLIGQTEVTQGQWQALMEVAPWQGRLHAEDNPNNAVSYVGWNDAIEFCRRLTDKDRRLSTLHTGATYTLPTEAQWEYACRAGTRTKYSFGDDGRSIGDYAWWGGLEGSGNARNARYAHEVGRKKPNDWNLYDMHGNVNEWCRDGYGDYPPDIPVSSDPFREAVDGIRVNRGGSWRKPPHTCESAARWASKQTDRTEHIGFRVVVNLE